MGKKITRSDGNETVEIGRNDDQIQMDQITKKASVGNAPPGATPSELIAIQQGAMAEIAPSESSMEKMASTEITENSSKVEELIQKAKQRLNGIKEVQADKKRYEGDPDPGRKADEDRSKDKYYKDYPKGKESMKKLKSSLEDKLKRLDEAIKKASDENVEKDIRVARANIRRQLKKLSSVEEDLRMKRVKYPKEKDPGREYDEKDSKDRYKDPKNNPINKQLEKMWSIDKGIPKKAMEDDDHIPEKKDKEDDKEMGGNDMKSLPKDEKKKEKDDKEPQKKELEKAVEEIKKTDEELTEVVEKLEDAAESLGVDIEVEKENGKIEPEVPFGKPDMKKKPEMPKSPLGDKEPGMDIGLDKGEKKLPMMASDNSKKVEAKEDDKDKDKAKEKKEKEEKEAKEAKEEKDKKKEDEKKKDASLEDRLSTDGITAVFTRMATKMNSYWTVFDQNKNKVIEASVRDIWGKKGFEMWEHVSSEDYGKLIINSIRNDGFEIVAKKMGTVANMTKEAQKNDVDLIVEAKDKKRTPAMTKKLTSPQQYIGSSELEKSIKPKLTKNYHKKASKESISERDFNKVVSYNRELEKSNRELQNQIEASNKKIESLSADKKDLVNESQLRVRANKAIELADYMVGKNMIKAENKNDEIDKMMLMDDVSFTALENITKDIAENSEIQAQSNNDPEQRFVRKGGLSSVPQTMTAVQDKGMKEKLEGIWSKPPTVKNN
jgi:hypothetical protein